ncbi:hypothetical protein [Frigoriglobus tundricola]|uniref:Glycosyltransferase 2-like domain-containing protein n=1 Tax=Frigoriglobus tundricola TaxID=2774151 RepID=A0A6M5YYV9_9BACT|nr:hypothetical protein [Frigoriglobus tundricola]QJW98724.1 hypothetical protein FTUN_6319 [Frigoriglobus tundricola]
MLNEPLYGVVVSEGYADYLDVCLTHNRAQLDRCVVVTSPDDHETRRVAGRHACELVCTRDGRRPRSGLQSGTPTFGKKDGGEFAGTTAFNKGAMIERGLQQLPHDGWRVHFDADILFPNNFRRRLGVALRDRACVYGVDRFNVVGTEAYRRLLASGFFHRGFEHHHFLTYPIAGCTVGSRLVFDDQGWLPLGYTQIWHASVEYSGIYRTLTYPTGSNTAAHDDVQFSLRWDREQRVLIPDLYVAHVLTADSTYAANWEGRKTAPFEPFKAAPKSTEGRPS